MTGTVRWFLAERGVGMIDPDEDTVPIHVDYRAIDLPVRVLQTGQRVTFDLVGTPQRPEARRVVVTG